METPLVAVVTLNWNGAAFLRECVDSILASDYPNFSLIVVDNGSTDNSPELLKSLYQANPKVLVIRNKDNLGYSKGMNVGLKTGFEEHKAQYCLVMNNDTRLDPHALSAMVEVAQREDKVGFVTGKVYYHEAPDTFQTVGKKKHPVFINGGHIGRGETDHGQYDEDSELAFCDDIFWLVSRALYQITGGYDPEFFLQAEDFDWQLRAKKAGFKIMYAHKAMLWHKESMSIGKASAIKTFYDVRNPIIAVLKNSSKEDGLVFWKLKVNKIVIPSMIKALFKAKFITANAMAKGLFSAWRWKRVNHV